MLSPNDFTDLDVVEQRLTRFEDRYNAAAEPFQWKFTTTKLNALLGRLHRHEQADTNARSAQGRLTPDELTGATT